MHVIDSQNSKLFTSGRCLPLRIRRNCISALRYKEVSGCPPSHFYEHPPGAQTAIHILRCAIIYVYFFIIPWALKFSVSQLFRLSKTI